MAQSTPQPPRTENNEVPDQQQQQQIADDEDPLFDIDGAVGPAPLPTNLQQRLNDIHDQLDPDTSQRIRQLGDSLNNAQVDRIQPANPDSNEDQPIRRVSVFKTVRTKKSKVNCR